MSEENTVIEDTARELAEFEKDKLGFLKSSRVVSFLLCLFGVGLFFYGLLFVGIGLLKVFNPPYHYSEPGPLFFVEYGVTMLAGGILLMYLGRWFSLYSRIFIRQRR